MDKLIIGTRGSKLALWQANWVRDELLSIEPDLGIEIHEIKTEGDARHDLAPGAFGKEGIFTAELDRALIGGRIDIAVHSLKDLPTRLGKGLALAAVTERAATTDTLVLRRDHVESFILESAEKGGLDDRQIDQFMKGKVVGTSSLRRIALLKHFYPGLEFAPMRGNLDTRMRKLGENEVDALVVATAGIHRLVVKPGGHRFHTLDYPWYLPAAGQGALGLETRAEGPARETAAFLNHGQTFMATAAERKAMSRLGAGCRVPAGFLGEIEDISLRRKGVVAGTDGKTFITAEAEGEDLEYNEVGERLAEKLLEEGAAEVLGEARG